MLDHEAQAVDGCSWENEFEAKIICMGLVSKEGFGGNEGISALLSPCRHPIRFHQSWAR